MRGDLCGAERPRGGVGATLSDAAAVPEQVKRETEAVASGRNGSSVTAKDMPGWFVRCRRSRRIPTAHATGLWRLAPGRHPLPAHRHPATATEDRGGPVHGESGCDHAINSPSAISGFVRAIRCSTGTPARFKRARSLVQLSGRKRRGATVTGISPRASVRDISVWQFAVLPNAEAYCAATPTECWPFFDTAVSSITNTASLCQPGRGVLFRAEPHPRF